MPPGCLGADVLTTPHTPKDLPDYRKAKRLVTSSLKPNHTLLTSQPVSRTTRLTGFRQSICPSPRGWLEASR